VDDQPRNGGLPDARALLAVVRAFLCFFWAVPLYLLILLRGSALKIVVVNRLELPPLAIAGGLTLVGALLLRRAGQLGDEWRRGAGNLTRASLLAVYFSFPADWWLKTQQNDYLFLNCLLLILTLMWIMQTADFLAGELGRRLGSRSLALEAEVAEWSVIVLQLLPYLVLFSLAVSKSLRYHLPLGLGMRQVVLRTPLWLRTAFFIPCAMTMSVCWRSRALSVRRLLDRAACD